MPRSFFKPTDLIEQAIEISQTTDTKVGIMYNADNNSFTFMIRPASGSHKALSLSLDHEFSGIGHTADQIMDELLQYSEMEVEDEF